MRVHGLLCDLVLSVSAARPISEFFTRVEMLTVFDEVPQSLIYA